ncbi:MAG: PsiF family protein [Burkholderiaceae bacterium]
MRIERCERMSTPLGCSPFNSHPAWSRVANVWGDSTMLNRLIVAACLALPVAAFAAETPATATTKKEPTAQQQKMGACNKDAAAKKLEGDARKTFMSECLSTTPAAAAEPKKELTPQQKKMSACNKDAATKKLQGEERKKFMSACLKG